MQSINPRQLVIGAAQFGSKYGITNKHGVVSSAEISKILDYSKSIGIKMIDTSPNYGESEEILGKVGVDDFNIFTKIPKYSAGKMSHGEYLNTIIDKTLKKMNLTKIFSVLIHDEKDAIGDMGGRLIDSLYKIKLSGKIDKIGISIYNPDILDQIQSIEKVDIVQAPINLVDMRIVDSGWLDKLKLLNISFYARSIFLQGLLLEKKSRLPKYFKKYSKTWDLIQNLEKTYGVNALSLCLSHVLSIKNIDGFIVGIENLKQLEQIVHTNLVNLSFSDTKKLVTDDTKLINPYNWIH